MFGLWSCWFYLLANGSGEPCTSFDGQEEPYGHRYPAVSG
jgi:hypothetical protein